MRQIVLPGTDMRVSRFAFGTAGLFNAGSARQRASILEAAIAHGFTHFDTAPYYGFGVAERDLKDVLARHPDVTVATKVGLYAPGGEDQPAVAVMARKVAGKLVPAISRPVADWSVARARVALAASLRRLGRERIDLYLLHEPKAALLGTEEWLRFLESERDRVVRFGVAVDPERLAGFVGSGHPLAPVIQTFDSIDDREADLLAAHGRPMQITYGYIRAAATGRPEDVPVVLVAALRRNRTGCVIVSTRRIERLRGFAAAVEAADRADAAAAAPPTTAEAAR